MILMEPLVNVQGNCTVSVLSVLALTADIESENFVLLLQVTAHKTPRELVGDLGAPWLLVPLL